MIRLKGATLALDRVFPNRAKPLRSVTLPAIMVYTSEEQRTAEVSEAPRILQRTTRLAVQVVVDAGAEAELEGTLDALALQIENAISSDPTLGGACADLVYAETSSDVGEESGRAVLAAQIEFDVVHETEENPVAALAEWRTARTVFDVKPPADSGEPEPASEIEIPTE